MSESLFKDRFTIAFEALFARVLQHSQWVCFLSILTLRFGIELANLHQPIFEGYIGRQIPTAMVARDLSNGGSFFYPKLQTGPFPSYFLVEPPIYACLVFALSSITGIELNASGRMLSLTGLIFACIGIWTITRKHYGRKEAFYAVTIMACWPVTVRFGRSFQPDMLAIGAFLLGMGFHESSTTTGSRLLRIIALFILSLALATKITLAPLLLVLPGLSLSRTKKAVVNQIALMVVVLLPSLAWYLWAAWIGSGSNSHSSGQSGDGLAFWLKMAGPLALFSKESLNRVLPNILWKSFTPLWIILIPALISIIRQNPLMHRWLFAVICWIFLVGAKAHHNYYWLVPGPLIAILCANWAADSSGKSLQKRFRHLFAISLISLGLCQSRETWKTPAEWLPIATDLSLLRNQIKGSGEAFLIAHEASVYAIGTKGLRWEWSELAQQRAISAWGRPSEPASPSPLKLLDFYLSQGGRWFLALESDPEWISGQAALASRLQSSRVVYQSGGLILYDLLSHSSSAGEP